MRVARSKGRVSKPAAATVAATQPSAYARCNAAATVAEPVRVRTAIDTAAAVSQASNVPEVWYCGPKATRNSQGPSNPAARIPGNPTTMITAAGFTRARRRAPRCRAA